jgi:hypothetical protein
MRYFMLIFMLAFSFAPAFAQDTNEVVLVDTDSAATTDTDVPATTEPAADNEQPPPMDGELGTAGEVVEMVQMVVNAAKEGNWGVLFAGVLMLLVWVTRTFLWNTFPKEWIPVATVSLATAAGLGTAILAGTGVFEAVMVAIGGLFTGFAAVGVWESIGKKVLPKPKTTE